MSLRRQKTETIEIQRQRSVKNVAIQNHFFHCQRKKYKPSTINIHSLHSIDTKRSSVNLVNNTRIKTTHRRRQLSIPVNEPKHMLTERPESIDCNDLASKKYSENRNIPNPFRQKYERIYTLEDEHLQNKERKIKNCIQLMSGVLQEIKQQKCRKVSKTKIIEQFPQISHENASKNNEPNGESKFETYIKNITKLKDSNKVILIKRKKSKSNITNENISSNVNIRKSFLNKEKEVAAQCEKENLVPKKSTATVMDSGKQSRKLLKLEEISCSSIEKANQSSFVSDFSRQSFMKNLIEDEGKAEERGDIQSRRITKFKNSKHLKQMFPIDFF